MPKKALPKSKSPESKKPIVSRRRKAVDPKNLPYAVAVSPIDGRGVFAARDIRKGEFIGEYEGPRATKNGKYVLWIYEDDGSVYDARSGKNGLRYLNHQRKPNAEFRGFELYAIRGIKSGTEITFNYGDTEAEFY